jgi:hypothetical protein
MRSPSSSWKAKVHWRWRRNDVRRTTVKILRSSEVLNPPDNLADDRDAECFLLFCLEAPMLEAMGVITLH